MVSVVIYLSLLVYLNVSFTQAEKAANAAQAAAEEAAAAARAAAAAAEAAAQAAKRAEQARHAAEAAVEEAQQKVCCVVLWCVVTSIASLSLMRILIYLWSFRWLKQRHIWRK